MMKFSEEIRARFPELREDFDRTEAFVDEYERGFVRRLELRDTLAGKIRLAVYSCFGHARQLTWTLVESINRDLPLGLFLATRAHLEATAMLTYLLCEVEEYRAGKSSAEKFSSTLDRIHLGRRYEFKNITREIAEATKAINILSLLKYVDRVIPAEEAKGIFADGYEWLSEFCHPNLMARLTSHSLVGNVVEFDESPRVTHDGIAVALDHGAVSHLMFFRAFDALAKHLEEIESTGSKPDAGDTVDPRGPKEGKQ
jgi:hypothetical protein